MSDFFYGAFGSQGDAVCFNALIFESIFFCLFFFFARAILSVPKIGDECIMMFDFIKLQIQLDFKTPCARTCFLFYTFSFSLWVSLLSIGNHLQTCIKTQIQMHQVKSKNMCEPFSFVFVILSFVLSFFRFPLFLFVNISVSKYNPHTHSMCV